MQPEDQENKDVREPDEAGADPDKPCEDKEKEIDPVKALESQEDKKDTSVAFQDLLPNNSGPNNLIHWFGELEKRLLQIMWQRDGHYPEVLIDLGNLEEADFNLTEEEIQQLQNKNGLMEANNAFNPESVAQAIEEALRMQEREIEDNEEPMKVDREEDETEDGKEKSE